MSEGRERLPEGEQVLKAYMSGVEKASLDKLGGGGKSRKNNLL
jgi:hypothetical protein